MIKHHNQKHDSKVQTSYFELMQLFATSLFVKFILINPLNLNSKPNPKTANFAQVLESNSVFKFGAQVLMDLT